jgi:molybdopterin-containing oxidoreductase family iron-sulfur binding subunit
MDPKHCERNQGRRSFLKGLGLATASLVGIGLTDRGEAAKETPAAPRAPLPLLPTVQEGESLLLRMQRELQRAMKKPIEERRWAMAIDLRKCIGCSACTIACVAENKLPPGVVYRPVIEEEIGEYPNVSRRFIPRPCLQCENPPCVPVCPVKATYKRPDGIVEIDYKACIGCRYCIAACPYGARTADFGEFYTDGTPKRQAYESQPSHEYGQSWTRDGKASPAGNARKCHFCIHRLEAGMLPACVTTCVGYATFFGDLNDPESVISEQAGKPNVMRLKEELGTKPRVFYLT